jgi:ribonuclease HI
MELLAVRELLGSTSSSALHIQCDSQYVINVFTVWLSGWRERGMRTGRGKPVENQELISDVAALLDERDATWEWVRGHAGHRLNEKADALARYAAERAKVAIETGHLPPGADPPRLPRP